MKYRNASEILPAYLVQEIQEHTSGELLYIPAVSRRPWGDVSGAKSFYTRRNAEIRENYFRGQKIEALSEAYFISDEAVRKIIYQKGGFTMKNEIGGYYWEDELVRLRRSRPEDWELNRKDGREDSQEQFFSDCYQALPVDNGNWPQIWEAYVKANESGEDRVLLAVETLDGTYVGGGNIHGIDERNGTFGIFIGCTEEKYTLAAARIMLDYAFNERRLHKCNNGIAMEGDTKTIALFEALGFAKEGVKRGEIFHQGRYWDEIHYGLLNEEFNKDKA